MNKVAEIFNAAQLVSDWEQLHLELRTALTDDFQKSRQQFICVAKRILVAQNSRKSSQFLAQFLANDTYWNVPDQRVLLTDDILQLCSSCRASQVRRQAMLLLAELLKLGVSDSSVLANVISNFCDFASDSSRYVRNLCSKVATFLVDLTMNEKAHKKLMLVADKQIREKAVRLANFNLFPQILLRTKDVSSDVAAAAYEKIASFSFGDLSAKEVQQIVANGISEKRIRPRTAFFTRIIPHWSEEVNGNLSDLILAFGFPQNIDEITLCMQSSDLVYNPSVEDFAPEDLFLRRVFRVPITESEINRLCDALKRTGDVNLGIRALDLFASSEITSHTKQAVASISEIFFRADVPKETAIYAVGQILAIDPSIVRRQLDTNFAEVIALLSAEQIEFVLESECLHSVVDALCKMNDVVQIFKGLELMGRISLRNALAAKEAAATLFNMLDNYDLTMANEASVIIRSLFDILMLHPHLMEGKICKIHAILQSNRMESSTRSLLIEGLCKLFYSTPLGELALLAAIIEEFIAFSPNSTRALLRAFFVCMAESSKRPLIIRATQHLLPLWVAGGKSVLPLADFTLSLLGNEAKPLRKNLAQELANDWTGDSNVFNAMKLFSKDELSAEELEWIEVGYKVSKNCRVRREMAREFAFEQDRDASQEPNRIPEKQKKREATPREERAQKRSKRRSETK